MALPQSSSMRTLAVPETSDGEGAAQEQSHRCRRRVVIAVATCSALLALAVLACRPAGRSLVEETFQAAYQAANDDGRRVEQDMSRPSLLHLDMKVQMIGVQTEHGHVTGHLVHVRNPQGRVSFALPAGGCGHRAKTSVTARGHYPRCRLAVNAGYFNVSNGACIGNLVVDGKAVQSVPLEQGNVNFGIKGGRMAIGYFTQEEVAGFDQLISGVTWLVRDGKRYVQDGWKEANTTVQTSGEKYATSLASRTALGWNAAGEMMVLQVDGSIAVGKEKRGMDMFEMADLLVHHGAIDAINLDGGGSSAMVRDGVLVNYPSDMRPPSCDASGDFQCERPVSSILCVHELPGVLPLLV